MAVVPKIVRAYVCMHTENQSNQTRPTPREKPAHASCLGHQVSSTTSNNFDDIYHNTTMFVRQLALLTLAAASASAFVTQVPQPTFKARNALLKDYEASLNSDIKREVRHDGWAFFL